MASKSQNYFNNISPIKRSTISIIIDACISKGITNQIFQAGLCAIVSKESDFTLKPESSYSKSSASSIRNIFGKRFDGYTDSQIDTIKLDDRQFFSIIYSSIVGNGDEASLDGWYFRGRGFNQLTFRGNYKAIGKNIGADLENKPELMETTDIAASALVQYYIDTFDTMKSSLFNQYGVDKKNTSILTMNGITDLATSVRILYQATAGPKKQNGSTPIGLYFDISPTVQSDGDLFFPNDNLGGFTKAMNNAPGFYKLITGTTPPVSGTASVIPPVVDGVQTSDQTNGQSPTASNPDSQSQGRDTQNDSTQSGNNDIVIPGLTNVFPPTLKIDPITFNVKGESDAYKREMMANLGWKPFVWYNAYQIADADISYFALYHDELLPTITIIFNDTMNLMRDKAFPLDDSKIKIFISSRSTSIRHILLEFKIKNFSINGSVYTIIGTLNVNGLLVKDYKSYSSKTSFFTIQDVCKEVGLGFNSNMSDSGDKMTWINPGLKRYDFLGEILQNSYISDAGFTYGYIDFYYNFNYVDIEKELSRDATEDKGVDTSGLGANISDGDKIYSMALSNDKSIKDSDRYISEYKVLNNSTAVSLYRGYLNISKFYDATKKEFLIFDVDSITSEGNKTIIMKGAPQDSQFYKENYMTTYVGKVDTDNSHVNYNYSDVHNSQNIEDLQKIGMKVTLPNPNYNLYRFQKILLIITNQSATPGNDIKNDRISGNWFIVDIKIVFNQGRMTQEISLIKRELEVSPEELSAEQDLNNETNPVVNNPVEKTTNPTDLTGTDVSPMPIVSGVTPSTTNDITPVVAPPPGKYDLEYIVGHTMLDNNGNIRSLVVIDGQAVDETVGIAFLQMRDAALKDGVEFSINPGGGFRPAFGPDFDGKTSKNKPIVVTTQEMIRRTKSHWILTERAKFKSDDDYVFNAMSNQFKPQVAKPGQSNHGSGIALDLSTGSRISYSKILKDDVYIWLIKNSWKYGFVRVVRTEEWHFEYRPNESTQGPYAKLSGGNGNLFYSDLGLDKIRIS